MAGENIVAEIGRAWDLQRKGQADAALKEFDRILSQSKDNIDAHYGMGLVKRSLGQNAAAVEHFQRALALVESATEGRRRANEGPEYNDPTTTEDDRLLMLTRMLKQRLAETSRV